MTEQVDAKELDSSPEVEAQTEEQANSEAAEATIEQTGDNLAAEDSFIPDEKMTDQVQKRINRLTWEKHQIEREKNAEIEALKAELAQAKSQANQAAPAKPKLSDFDYDDEAYADALADWKLAQRGESKPAPEVKASQPQIDPVVQSWAVKQRDYAASNAEYVQLVSDPLLSNAIPNGSGVEKYIVESEIGPKLHHHLLNHADDLIRIAALPEYKQGAELAKIESKLSQVKPKVKSNAPDPVTPVSNGSKPTGRSAARKNIMPF